MRTWTSALLIIGVAAGSSCSRSSPQPRWDVVFGTWGVEAPVRLHADCRFTMEIRVYQDNVEKLRTDFAFPPPAASIEAPDVDLARPIRMRAFFKSVEGCPPLEPGQIHYFPSADGWAVAEPLGRGGRITFDHFSIWMNPAPR